MENTRPQRNYGLNWVGALTLLLVVVVSLPGSTPCRTRGEMITLFRSAIGEKDSTNTGVTNTDIRQWIDEAQDWITSQNSPREFDTTYAVTAGGAIFKYDLPTRMESIYGVLAIDDTGLLKGSLMKIAIDSLGVVDRGKGTYSVFGSALYVFTRNLFEGDSLLVMFYGAPAYAALDTSQMTVAQTQEPFIVEYCTYRLLTSRNFWAGAMEMKQIFKGDLIGSRQSRVATRATE